jgi:hypothetical protein
MIVWKGYGRSQLCQSFRMVDTKTKKIGEILRRHCQNNNRLYRLFIFLAMMNNLGELPG